MRRCSGGLVVANGLRALNCALRKISEPSPWYCWVPGLVRISTRPRPGREYSAEYGILVDPDLLHRRRADVERAHLHAVDDDGDAAVADRSGIEELRHRRDEVVVEDRQAVEHVLIDRDRVDVVAGGRADLGDGVAHGDFLRQRREVEHEALRGRRPGADANPGGGRLESLVARAQLVGAGCHALEPEGAGGVGVDGLDDRAGGVDELNGRGREGPRRSDPGPRRQPRPARCLRVNQRRRRTERDQRAHQFFTIAPV